VVQAWGSLRSFDVWFRKPPSTESCVTSRYQNPSATCSSSPLIYTLSEFPQGVVQLLQNIDGDAIQFPLLQEIDLKPSGIRCVGEDLPEYPTTARVQRGDPGPYSHPISEIYDLREGLQLLMATILFRYMSRVIILPTFLNHTLSTLHVASQSR
jgi:hypothetical protein